MIGLSDEFFDRHDGETPETTEESFEASLCGNESTEIAEGSPGVSEGGNGPGEATQSASGGERARSARSRFLGDYELVEVLGRGGMGIVFRARQISLHREVALKVIRRTAGEKDVRRFLLEAEAVASLDHPGIVPIYEIGNDKGRPYFSMKLIEGETLKQASARLRHDYRTVARLVVISARAVQHAHDRGILHRDLKPANILLDSDGLPHVTDFGLAKKLDSTRTETTQTGAMLGTPAYMAPEQATGAARTSVTVQTDIYGLGAVLYSVLSGRAPHRGISLMQILESIREQTPQSLSSTDSAIPRDLEIICMKCLEKDPKRRYRSAGDLADDLERWLDHRPILARPVDPLSRLVLWCRRRPVQATLGGCLAASLLVGAVGVYHQWSRAQREAFVNSRVYSFLRSVILGGEDPSGFASSRFVTLETVFDRALQQVGNQYPDLPEIEAEERLVIGCSLGSLGRFRESEEQLRKSYELYLGARGANHRETQNAAATLGAALLNLNRPKDALPLLETARSFLARELGPLDQATLAAQSQYAACLNAMGDAEGAAKIVKEVVAHFQRHETTDRWGEPTTSDSQKILERSRFQAEGLLGAIEISRRNIEAGERLLRASLAGLERLEGPGHRSAILVRHNLIGLMISKENENFADVTKLADDALKISRASLGDTHLDTLRLLMNIASLSFKKADLAKADEASAEASKGLINVLGENHPEVWIVLNNRARILQERERFDEAETIIQKVIASTQTHGTELETAKAEMNLADVLIDPRNRKETGKRLDEAEALTNHALPILRESRGVTREVLSSAILIQGRIKFRRGEFSQAEELLAECLKIRRGFLKPGHWRISVVLSEHGEALTRIGRTSEGKAEIVEAYDSIKSAKNVMPGRVEDCLARRERFR